MSEGHRIDDASQAFNFMLAGKATVTFKSLASGNHMTFVIKKPRGETKFGVTHFVQVRTGNDYGRLGMIQGGYFKSYKKADLPESSKQFETFLWAYRKLRDKQMPKAFEFWHEGRCGRCGRALTDPNSIASGIGPECASKMECY